VRIVIVGPTHPYKGGIAQHTTRLAHQLSGAGHQVRLESWARQYPRLLYPGQLTVPDGRPELPPFPHTRAELAWNRPDTWLRAGRRARQADALVLPVASPVQIPALRGVVRGARRARGSDSAGVAGARRGGPRVVALMHNVLPHEPKPWDRPLVRGFLRAADAVMVHSAEQRDLAQRLGAPDPTVAALPANLSGEVVAPRRRTSSSERLRVLAFGLVRPYKGVDVLLQAAALVPSVHVTVAGEFWTPEAETRRLVEELGIADRTVIRAGYIPTGDVPALFAAADLVALPYLAATGSGNLRLACGYARPVIVSRVGSFPGDVGEGELGLVVAPGDVESLAAGLREAARPEVFNPLCERVAQVAAADRDQDTWEAYAAALAGAAGPGGRGA
jgi:glycosyltransferase involved in cell wall biosynthesis